MTSPDSASDGSPDHPATVAAAMRGDRRALQSIWEANRGWVAAVLLAYRPRGADVEDLLQEVAMTLITKIHTVHDAGNLRAWLRRVAVNVAQARGRHERSRPAIRMSELGDHWRGPASDHQSASRTDHSCDIMSLVWQLPDAYREPLLLKAVHGMRSRQIAEILEINEATVDTRISRARRMLREQAEQQREGDVAATAFNLDVSTGSIES